MDYFEFPTLHKCLIKLPDKFSPKKKYPLVIGLHGGGGTAIDFINLWEEIHNEDFIFAAPQGPYPMVMNDELCFDWGNWNVETIPWRMKENAILHTEQVISKASKLSEKYIMKVSQELKKKYTCDAVYLLGFSQGAIFSYRTGLKNSKHFKGLVILSGPGLLEPINNPFTSSKDHDWLTKGEIQEAENLRVFITHGREDQSVNYELGIKSSEILSSQGHEVRFSDFDEGHVFPPKAILEEICQWIIRE